MNKIFGMNNFKTSFPIFQNRPGLIYLDNAATTQKPQVVVDSLVDFYTKYNANIGRSVCALGDEASIKYDQARVVVQNFINAESREEIIFTRGTTESTNLAAAILTETFQRGDEIILSELEHHSNLIPWQQAAERRGLKLKFIPVLESGELDLEAYEKLFTPKTKLVAVSHLSNVLGTVSDISRIIKIAHGCGALVLVDGAQAVSKIVVDVKGLDCDFYAFSGHKIYGPTGIGVLYGKKELLEQLPTYQTGGKTIDLVDLHHSTLAPLPAKYEAGTPDIAGAIGLAAALEFVNSYKDQKRGEGRRVKGEEGFVIPSEVKSSLKIPEYCHPELVSGSKKQSDGKVAELSNNFELLFTHEKELTDYAEQKLREITGVKVYGAQGNKLGVVPFNVEGIHSLDIATYLAGQNICLRSGHHCCQPLMHKLGVETSLRISFGVYNDQADVDYFIEKLQRAIEILFP